jgi:hypothetical protein
MLAIDLFCGLGGWTEGLLAEGYEVIGFDIEEHAYGDMRYPGKLVIQDVLTLHGSQFKDAALIVASPPCQTYSYMAMPWSKAKAIEDEYLSGVRDVAELNALFDACFRIQREACAAAGRHIPMVVENVRGAQKWVGRSRWNYGSFHLWGDVPALMPAAVKAQKFNPDGTAHPPGSWFAIADSKNRGSSGQKVPGFRFDGSGKSFQSASVAEHLKVPGFRFDGSGGSFQTASVKKQPVWFNDDKRKCGGDWFGTGEDCSLMRRMSSRSSARKAASAQIAKIPRELACYVARTYRPEERAA